MPATVAERDRDGNVPVVGVGVGPGGRDECAALLSRLPADFDQAVILAGETDPEGVASCALPVVPAEDGAAVERGRVYVAARGVVPMVEGARLHLAPGSGPRCRPIDRLFRSIAATNRDDARAVLLAAADDDGTLGAREIRRAGGITLATARTPDPLEGGTAADLVRGAGEIASLLRELAPVARPDWGPADLERLSGVFFLLQAAGAECWRVRVSHALRVVGRRMRLVGAPDLGAYVDHLAADARELERLRRDLRRRTLGFFHEPELLDAVCRAVLEGAGADRPVRIWVPDCGTGEEVYSIAMALADLAAARGREPVARIFATDEDDELLRIARSGSYPDDIRLDVGDDRLERHFRAVRGRWRVRRRLRDLCTFGRHDPFSDPPLGQIDLVWLPHTFEHLDPAALARLLPRFHHGLAPSGRAIFGRARELVGALFESSAEIEGVYVRRECRVARAIACPSANAAWIEPELHQQAESLLLERHAPPAVVVDRDWRILLTRGETGRWLAPEGGPDLTDRLRPELLPEVEGLLTRADAQGVPVRGAGADVVPMTVGGARVYLVAFADRERAAGEPCGAEPEGVGGALSARLRDREEELENVREELRAVTEDVERTWVELAHARVELEAAADDLRVRNAALATAERELRSLLAALELPMVTVDADLAIGHATPAGSRLFRIGPDDVGRPIGALAAPLDGRRLEGGVRQVLRTGESARCQAQDADGHWWALSIRPLRRAPGRVDGAVLVAIDIDPLKQSLERTDRARKSAEAVLDAVDQPLVVVDRELGVLRTNRAFDALLGVERPVGRALEALPWADRGVEGVPDVLRTLAEGAPVRADLSVGCPDGSRRHFRARSTEIGWDEPVGGGWLLSLEDVTQQRLEFERATELLREQAARREAEAAIHAKDEFLAMLAHELRNPLAPLQSAVQLLQRSAVDPSVGWTLDLVSRQVRHLARLVDDLLDASRLAQHKVVPRFALVELLEIVRRVAEIHRPSVDQAGLALDLALPTGEVWLLADATRIEQILTNVLQNAVKYSPDGGRIRVAVEPEDREVAIRVRDQGVGIDPELLPRVFDLFVQGRQALDRARGGLGIGLTIVKQLVELHGGTVSAHSEGPGRGSEFVIRLPLQPPPRHELALEHAPPMAPAPRRVLLVDDNRDAADTFAELLRSAGHEVQVAYDGPSALAVLHDRRPDVVLLDLGLPEMDGFEVAREIRRRFGDRSPRLVAVTGYGDERDRQRTEQAGFDAHLVKPLEPEVMDRLLLDPAR